MCQIRRLAGKKGLPAIDRQEALLVRKRGGDG
jgi:hypothetical protein